MGKDIRPDHPVHEIIADRWSPYGLAAREVAEADLRSLFEAARWSASCFNEQPWRYLVATKRQPDEFARMLECLVEANQAWASSASALALGLAKTTFTRNGKPNRTALHDLGAASSSLSLEASARGIAVHQMAGIDPEKARRTFSVPDDFEVVTALAFGYAADATDLDEKFRTRDEGERTRRPQSEFVFASEFGKAAWQG